MEAQANDEEAAAALVGIELPESETSERWSEWSPERDALARIEDRLQDVARAIVQSAGGSPGRFRPADRPQSALERLRREYRREQHRQLVARVLRRLDQPVP